MIITTLITAAASRILEGEVKDKQKVEIEKHTKRGFVPGARVRCYKGPQKNRQMIVEQVKHLWLIGRDDDGDLFRLLVVNCEIVEPKPLMTKDDIDSIVKGENIHPDFK